MSGKGKWTLRSGVRGDGAAGIKTQCMLKYLYCVCGMLMWHLASTQAATLGQAPQSFSKNFSHWKWFSPWWSSTFVRAHCGLSHLEVLILLSEPTHLVLLGLFNSCCHLLAGRGHRDSAVCGFHLLRASLELESFCSWCGGGAFCSGCIYSMKEAWVILTQCDWNTHILTVDLEYITGARL